MNSRTVKYSLHFKLEYRITFKMLLKNRDLFSCLPPLALAHLIHWPDWNPYCWARSALIFYSHKVTHIQIAAKVCKKLWGRSHYYDWHASVNFLRLCFVHVWQVPICFDVWEESFFLMTLEAPLKYQIHHSGCVVNHHGDVDRLNLCLSQAWLELKSDNSHF